jgi:rsbT antagonist protein RsbS
VKSHNVPGGRALEENRVPVVRLKNCLIVSIQGSLHDRQALQLQEDILAETKRNRSRGLILDISAVPILDSYLTRVLNNIAREAQLMGTRSAIVGMRPAIAIALVTMGLEFGANVETALNLDAALELMVKDEAASPERES